jgi:hypothetical protein
MSSNELIQPIVDGSGAGITSEIAAHRAKKVVLHNSPVWCWGIMLMGVCAAFIGICMMLMVISVLSPLSAISFMRVLAAAQWGLGGFMMCYLCKSLWQIGRRMAHKKVKLDERGADFTLGTKKQPIELFMEWSDVASVTQKRVGNIQEFTVTGKDGSFARFNSYSFVRPKKVAHLIAERAGQTIQAG